MVIQIHPISVQVPGATQDGYVLTWDNTDGYWEAKPGASSEVSGPASGDLNGSYPNPTVAKIEGNPVQPATYGAAQDGYVLTWVNADGYIEAKPVTGGGSFTAGGDLSGSSSSQTVNSAQNGVITFTGGTTPEIQGGASATQLTIGTNKSGAALFLQADAATTIISLASTGLTFKDTSSVMRGSWENTHGNLMAGGGGTDAFVQIGTLVGAPTYAAVYVLNNGATPSSTNYAFLGDGTSAYFNAPNAGSGSLFFRFANTSYITLTTASLISLTPLIQFDSSLSTGTIGTNKSGAKLVLQGGTTGTDGYIALSTNTVSSSGGTTPLLGLTGGSGPASGTAFEWLKIKDGSGNIVWIPVFQ